MISSDALTPDLPPDLVEEYLAGMRATLGLLASLAGRLSAAGNDRDALEALHREVHKIHGSAGSYGFADASRLAAGLEATTKDWVAQPDDPEVDRASLVRWFVARLAAMLGMRAVAPPATPPPQASPGSPRAAALPPRPLPRIGPPPRPSQAAAAKRPPPPFGAAARPNLPTGAAPRASPASSPPSEEPKPRAPTPASPGPQAQRDLPAAPGTPAVPPRARPTREEGGGAGVGEPQPTQPAALRRASQSHAATDPVPPPPLTRQPQRPASKATATQLPWILSPDAATEGPRPAPAEPGTVELGPVTPTLRQPQPPPPPPSLGPPEGGAEPSLAPASAGEPVPVRRTAAAEPQQTTIGDVPSEVPAATPPVHPALVAPQVTSPPAAPSETPLAGPASPDTALAVPEVISVEDDAALAELLEYGLRARGYRFRAYRNGRDALRDLLALDVQGTKPLLLLDVDLPALDGYSIFHALQQGRPDTYRVVFTTVHGTEEEQLRGLEAGALDYMVKPISLRVALEKIKRWVGR